MLKMPHPVAGYRSVINLPSKNCQINPTVTLLKINGQKMIALRAILVLIFRLRHRASKNPSPFAAIMNKIADAAVNLMELWNTGSFHALK